MKTSLEKIGIRLILMTMILAGSACVYSRSQFPPINGGGNITTPSAPSGSDQGGGGATPPVPSPQPDPTPIPQPTPNPPPAVTGICGDGHLDAGEECDDGNLTVGDGCDQHCKTEHFAVQTFPSNYGFAFVSDRTSVPNIFASIPGKPLMQVTQETQNLDHHQFRHPKVSPNDKKVAFDWIGNLGTTLALFDVQGRSYDDQELYASVQTNPDGQFALQSKSLTWNADGSKVSFVQYEESSKIYKLMHDDTPYGMPGVVKEYVGQAGEVIEKAVWDHAHPNDILFSMSKGAGLPFGVYARRINDPIGTIQPIPGLEEARDFALSPDGHTIAYVKDSHIYACIYMSFTCSSSIQVTKNGMDEAPAWSQDSKMLLFTCDRTGNKEICAMNNGEIEGDKRADGSLVLPWNLTDNPADDYDPEIAMP